MTDFSLVEKHRSILTCDFQDHVCHLEASVDPNDPNISKPKGFFCNKLKWTETMCEGQ